MKKWRKNVKRVFSVILAAMLALSVAACSSSTESSSGETASGTSSERTDGKKYVIGALVYKYDDVYLSTVRAAMQQYADKAGNIELKMYDGQGDQGKQLDQLDAILQDGVDCLFVNMCDQSSAQTVINQVKDKKIPLVFFNREPTDISVLKNYDKDIFVGTKAQDAGIMQGDMLAQLWKADKSLDRNGDGKVQYVVFKGEADNLEAIARTEYCQSEAKEKGLNMDAVAPVQVCDWTAEKAMNAMEAILSSNNDIEAVLCNNDDMATGAISALQNHGYNTGNEGDKKIVVLGVDGTDAAKSAIASGTMMGTVKQDGDAMAKACVNIAENYLSGKSALEGTGYQLDETGVAIRIPYSSYTGK
ncbi:galactose ABC transporter substrate-binding protein [Caproiciproducens sp. CPB-2]|uniref:galactose ABC transporter substrate-binding protein n=1 Tax=Caproiciproducens sp. CPB-2 TaxID=3030017 RepID=UPI0023D9E13F|nr:galactose ABC transporter substrate-binding protein [Caproiciproducens sp. CPB-2]MDF1494380.1 galactose ABC transporter substrate-binding protein [Caproiciproducens sp. CPB-2]